MFNFLKRNKYSAQIAAKEIFGDTVYQAIKGVP